MEGNENASSLRGGPIHELPYGQYAVRRRMRGGSGEAGNRLKT